MVEGESVGINKYGRSEKLKTRCCLCARAVSRIHMRAEDSNDLTETTGL